MQIDSKPKEYTCTCGKSFTNAQSFNGHKCHCKVHRLAKGGENDYEVYKANQTKSALLASKAKKAKDKEKRELALSTWLAEKHVCERCGKIMTEKYGSGRFCSEACAHSRVLSDEVKQKIRESLNTTLVKHQKAPIRSKKACRLCGAPIKSSNKTGLCRNCLDHTSEGVKVKRELGKKGYATKQMRGTHKGWQSRKVTSYAEKFWQQVLDNNNIAYEREFLVVHNKTHYFLDFKLIKNNKVIDLEINGKQHTYEDRAASDTARDELLQGLGYIIYRIPWNELKTVCGKSKMQDKINSFLAFYSEL